MFSDLIGLLSGKISRSFCQTKLREIEQVTLWLLSMTKHSSFLYTKHGPGFLKHHA